MKPEQGKTYINSRGDTVENALDPGFTLRDYFAAKAVVFICAVAVVLLVKWVLT